MEYVHRCHTIERFYQDAKSELGFDLEGRSWRGLHKHWAMAMLVYCWLTLERRYGGYMSRQYEIVVDRPVVEAPNFNSGEIFPMRHYIVESIFAVRKRVLQKLTVMHIIWLVRDTLTLKHLQILLL